MKTLNFDHVAMALVVMLGILSIVCTWKIFSSAVFLLTSL